MKICVYTIALNEIKFAERFVNSCKEADLILVCDTGSTDGTAEKLRELGVTVYNITQQPWRFDTARNIALNLVPPDFDLCISIDLDEMLQPGWRQELERLWHEHSGKIDRVRYDYIWNWLDDDVTPDSRFYVSKIHTRSNYCWDHPCHEIIKWLGDRNEVIVTTDNIQVHHRADNSKSRGQYLPLLEMGVKEKPDNDRARHYYARELMFKGRYKEAIEHFMIHVKLPSATWDEERAASWRFASECYTYLGDKSNAQTAALRAVMEFDRSRETWTALSKAAMFNSDWQTCNWAAKKALEVTVRNTTYRTEAANWTWIPHDHVALSAFYLGNFNEAIEHGKIALSLNPSDVRLKTNLDFYLSKI